MRPKAGTTLAALLNSLRMGFQTLAIEQQAVEVWRVLGAVKTEFAKFGGVLEKVKRQLDTASRTIDETGRRTRAMQRRLRSVEELSEAESSQVLELTAADEAAAIVGVAEEYGSEDWGEAADAGADADPGQGQAGSESDSLNGLPVG